MLNRLGRAVYGYQYPVGGRPGVAFGSRHYGIMCSVNRNYYREARLIEEKLAQADRPDWALLVDDAIEGGSSASDILTRLRDTLAQIRNQHLGLPAQLDSDIEKLRKALDQALAGPRR